MRRGLRWGEEWRVSFKHWVITTSDPGGGCHHNIFSYQMLFHIKRCLETCEMFLFLISLSIAAPQSECVCLCMKNLWLVCVPLCDPVCAERVADTAGLQGLMFTPFCSGRRL